MLKTLSNSGMSGRFLLAISPGQQAISTLEPSIHERDLSDFAASARGDKMSWIFVLRISQITKTYVSLEASKDFLGKAYKPTLARVVFKWSSNRPLFNQSVGLMRQQPLRVALQ